MATFTKQAGDNNKNPCYKGDKFTYHPKQMMFSNSQHIMFKTLLKKKSTVYCMQQFLFSYNVFIIVFQNSPYVSFHKRKSNKIIDLHNAD